MAEAAKLIRAAKSPILLVGHGVHTSRTQAQVKELAELMACPVIQTSGGTSFIPGLEERTFPYLFSPAANEAVEESDLCVALGTELGEPMHYGRTQHWAGNNANRKWVYVEQDPTAIGVNRPVDVPLVGDLRGVVPQLVEALKDGPRKPSADLDRWSRPTPQSWRGWPKRPRADAPRCTLRATWSRRPRRSMNSRTASWCAMAARP